MDEHIKIGDVVCGRDYNGFFIYQVTGITSEHYEGHVIYDPWNQNDGMCEIPFQYEGMHFLRKITESELELVKILAK